MGGQRVATHPLEAVPLAGRHAERGMEIEAVAVRVAKYRPSTARPVKCGGSGPNLSPGQYSWFSCLRLKTRDPTTGT